MGEKRRRILKYAGMAALGGVAGCLGGNDSGSSEETTTTSSEPTTTTTDPTTSAPTETTTTATTTAADPGTNVGMVYALGGLGDKSFNDMANRGAKQAKVQYDVSFDNSEPGSPSDIQKEQAGLASSSDPNYDLINCIGFLHRSPLETNAESYSDQKFAIVDTVLQKDNVASYVFKEHEGSFQTGYLAGLLTQRDLSAGAGATDADNRTVGFVGGQEIPPVKRFEAGYKAGVEHANENIQVLTSYVGAFDDVEGGRSAATTMYESGADVVYHAAGASGLGVFQAAQSNGRFAIGVDSDQSTSDPKYANVILASMVKRIDTAVFRAIESVVNDSFKGGSVQRLGLTAENTKDGVEIVYGRTIGDAVPDTVRSKLQTTRQKIIQGEISVPTSP